MSSIFPDRSELLKASADPYARIAVVGCSCSGKSTLAQRLAEALDSPYVELDSLHWLPGWKERPKDELRSWVDQRSREPRWIIDGNYYSKVGDMVLSRATTVIWLNYSFPRVLWRSVRRTIHRVATKQKVCAGNTETFRQAFLSRESAIHWMTISYSPVRERYRALFRERRRPGVEYIECRHPLDADRILAAASHRHRKSPAYRLDD